MRKSCDDAHEPFLSDEEINQPFDVRFFPLELEVVLGLSTERIKLCSHRSGLQESHRDSRRVSLPLPMAILQVFECRLFSFSLPLRQRLALQQPCAPIRVLR